MPENPDDGQPPSHFDELRRALSAAIAQVDDLADDALATRIVAALRTLPADDQPVVVDVVEREAQARALSLATERATGQSMHANPNARLFLRRHSSDPPRVDVEVGELTLAMLRGMEAAAILTVPAIHAEWLAATRRAVELLPAPQRRLVTGLVATVLDLLRAAEPPPE